MTLRIIFRLLLMSLIFSAIALQGYSASADEASFPFRADVIGDQVNVRAGQSADFERLCQLNKGDEAVVLEKGFGWYKIQLPSSAKSFVHKEYVQFLGQNAGGVTGSRVNIRAGAGVHYTVLGQLTKGEQIFIEEDLDEWYRIQPALNSCGWVAEKFLTFKTNDVSAYKEAIAEKVIVDLESPESPELDEVEELEELEEEVTQEIVKGGTKDFYGVGYVEAYEDDEKDGIHYKITAAGRPVCYVQGVNHMLGRFKNLRVSVEGSVNQKLQSKYAHPVIIVSKVRLML